MPLFQKNPRDSTAESTVKSCILVLAAARKNKPFILEEARDVFLPVASPTSPSKREEVMSVKQVLFFFFLTDSMQAALLGSANL